MSFRRARMVNRCSTAWSLVSVVCGPVLLQPGVVHTRPGVAPARPLCLQLLGERGALLLGSGPLGSEMGRLSLVAWLVVPAGSLALIGAVRR